MPPKDVASINEGGNRASTGKACQYYFNSTHPQLKAGAFVRGEFFRGDKTTMLTGFLVLSYVGILLVGAHARSEQYAGRK